MIRKRIITNSNKLPGNIKPHKLTENNSHNNSDSLLREEDAAQVLGLSPRTLQAWRYSGNGPEHVRLSRRAIRYRMRDLMDFVAQSQRQNTI